MRALPAESVTLDGEAVIADPETSVTDFYALRLALARREGSPDAFLYAFDLPARRRFAATADIALAGIIVEHARGTTAWRSGAGGDR